MQEETPAWLLELFAAAPPPPATRADALKALATTLNDFIGGPELCVIKEAMRGEEGQWFIDKVMSLASLVEGMPKSYETNGQGDAAIVQLHYFKGSHDWYVTEKDSDPDGDGQLQAFGLVINSYGPELGYICLKELIACKVELDLHWQPKTLAEVRKSRPEIWG